MTEGGTKVEAFETEAPEVQDAPEKERCCGPKGRSLMASDKVPTFARFLVIVLAVTSIILFISSHTSVGASVMIKIIVPDQELVTPEFPEGVPGVEYKIDSVFDFTLANSVSDMWEAEVYPLALLIAVFSGGWPYLKNILIMTAWAAPLTRTSRAQFLRWLDILGKYSLVDVIVLVVMMVTFKLIIETPSLPIEDWHDSLPPLIKFFLDKYLADHGVELPDTIHGIIVRVWVIPGWGIFGFVIAVILSLIGTHVAMYYHQVEQRGDATIENIETSGDMVSLRTYHFTWNKTKLVTKTTYWGQLWVIGAVVFTAIMLNAGASIKSFEFDYGGAAALFLDEAHPRYSLFTLAEALLDTDGLSDHNAQKMEVMWVIFMFFCYIIPVVHIFILGFVYLVPMTLKWQWWFLSIVGVFHAWGTLEVFVISLFAAVLQTPQFVEFIIGHHCDLINEFLQLAHDSFPDQYPMEPKCVVITTKMLEGAYTLIFCMIWYVAISNTLQSLVEDVVQDRFALDAASETLDKERSKCDLRIKAAELHVLTSCCCVTAVDSALEEEIRENAGKTEEGTTEGAAGATTALTV